MSMMRLYCPVDTSREWLCYFSLDVRRRRRARRVTHDRPTAGLLDERSANQLT